MNTGLDTIESNTRRSGFTLLELLLVMSLLAVVSSIAIPQVAWLLADQKIVRAGNLLREEMMRTRLEAMRSGRIYVIEAELESANIRVKPYFSLTDSVNAIDQTGTQSALLNGADQGQITAVNVDEEAERTIELPEEVFVKAVAVVSSARSMEIEQATMNNQSQGFGQPILFYPDGTTSTAAVVLSHPTHGSLTVKMRGITGDVTVGELGANE